MEKLSQIGEKLLKKPVSRVNLENGLFEPLKNRETNEDALKRLVKKGHFYISVVFIQLHNFTILLNYNNIFDSNVFRFAKILSQERRLREMKSPHTKKSF